MERIDFVVLWVDGSDPEWRKERARYSTAEDEDDSEIRYRDAGLLRYWFRGVAECAPWVNRVFFVTCGHLPPWLDTECPKLRIVRHADYMTDKWLPTFSSHAIELNLHRISDLSEQFVLFNDDTFLMKPMSPEDFFVNGLPCDTAVMTPLLPKEEFAHIVLSNTIVLNRNFNMRQAIRNNFTKWFNCKYGVNNLRNLIFSLWPVFLSFCNYHLPNAFLKSTFQAVWEREPEILELASMHRFRNFQDVNQYLMEYWQLATGKFHPHVKNGVYYDMNQVEQIKEDIQKSVHQMICINDAEVNDFDAAKKAIKQAFETRFPTKSIFER